MSEPTRPHPTSKLREHKSYGRVARASAMWAYMRAGIQVIVTIPTTIILARLLTPEEFGIAAAATFFGQLSARLSSSGMGSALVRLKEVRSEHISTVFTLNAGMTTLFVMAMVAAAPAVGAFYGSPEVGWLLPVVAINFLFGALSQIQQALLSRDLRYKEMATIGSVDMTVGAIASVVFALMGLRYWSLVLGEICGAFVKFVYGVRIVGWHAKLGFDRAAARELSSFAAGSFARRLLEHLTRNVDNVVVGKTLGLTALGFYDKAFAAVNKLYLRMTVVGPGVSFRIFSIIQDEPERFRRAYRKVILTATLLTYSMFAALAVMGPHLIVVAFGERWAPSVVPFQVLCASFSLKVLNQFAVSASQARGWIWPQVWRQMVQVACIVVAVYLLTPWGIAGAAFGVLGASIVMFFLTQGMMRKATGLGWADILQPQIPSITLALLVTSVLWIIDAALAPLGTPHFVILGGQALAAALIGLAFAWWCPFGDARALLHELVSDVSPRLAGWVWKDVAIVRQEEKSRRRRDKAQMKSELDASGHVAP